MLTSQQKASLENVLNYSMQDERKNFENEIAGNLDDDDMPADIDDISDDDFYTFAKDNYGTDHIWFDLYNLLPLI